MYFYVALFLSENICKALFPVYPLQCGAVINYCGEDELGMILQGQGHGYNQLPHCKPP